MKKKEFRKMFKKSWLNEVRFNKVSGFCLAYSGARRVTAPRLIDCLRMLNAPALLAFLVLLLCFTENGWGVDLKNGENISSQTLTSAVRVFEGNNVLRGLTINPAVIDNKNNAVKETVQSSKNVKLIDCKFGEVGQVHVSLVDPVDWVIDGCHFYKNHSSAKWHGQAISANSPTRLTIKNSLFEECEGTGVIVFHYKATDILIENCVFLNCDGGNGIIASLAQSTGTKNVIVRNCTFINCNLKNTNSGTTGVNFPHKPDASWKGNKCYNNVYINSRKIVWGRCERFDNIVDGDCTVSSSGDYIKLGDALAYDPKTFETKFFKSDLMGAKLVDFNPGAVDVPEPPVDPDPPVEKKGKVTVYWNDGTITQEDYQR